MPTEPFGPVFTVERGGSRYTGVVMVRPGVIGLRCPHMHKIRMKATDCVQRAWARQRRLANA